MLKRNQAIPAALLVAGLSIAGPACATQTYRYRGDVYSRDVERQAFDYGYRDGLRDGERDGRNGRSFSFNRHDDWRDADAGYSRSYGERDVYRRNYRRGFEAGYTDSYNRFGGYARGPRVYPSYPTYPSYPAYPAPGRAVARTRASEVGYRDGFDAGRDDARDRRAFEPQRSRRYRDADHEYENRYGSRDEYKREYRSAFQQGYEDGFRGARR